MAWRHARPTDNVVEEPKELAAAYPSIKKGAPFFQKKFHDFFGVWTRKCPPILQFRTRTIRKDLITPVVGY